MRNVFDHDGHVQHRLKMPPNLPLLLLSLLLFSWRCGCELRVRVGPDNPASSLASSPAHSDNNNEEAEEDPLGADADVDAEEEANRDRERQRAVYSQVRTLGKQSISHI